MTFFKVALAFLVKIFAYKKGASALASLFISVSISFSLNHYIDIFMSGTDKKVMLMPIFVESAMFFLFFMLCLLDLKYGSKVALEIREEHFDWDRVWDTAAKMFGIVFITSMLMVFSIVFESLNSRTLWWASFTPLCFLWLLANGFEFGSLGRHIEALRGSKPDIFRFFDSALNALQKKAIEKIDTSFKLNDNETSNSSSSSN